MKTYVVTLNRDNRDYDAQSVFNRVTGVKFVGGKARSGFVVEIDDDKAKSELEKQLSGVAVVEPNTDLKIDI